MTATLDAPTLTSRSQQHQDLLDLEDEAIHVIREVVGQFERPVLVTSDSPASAVLLHLASLAFWPGRVPFAVVDPESDLDGVDSVAQRFDAVLDGADETAERVFSVHDELGQLDPRPQLWELYNGRRRPGQHVRVFPLSRWTERDIAVYLADVCPVS